MDTRYSSERDIDAAINDASFPRSHDLDAYVNNCRSSLRLFASIICTFKLDCIVVDATLRYADVLHVERQSSREAARLTLFCNKVMDALHVEQGMSNS